VRHVPWCPSTVRVSRAGSCLCVLASPPSCPSVLTRRVCVARATVSVICPVLETIKAAQEKNGLRHHDYLRYRQYCTRKLRRLRSGKQIKLTQGRGRRYVQKNVTPDIVTEERHLHLPLFNAERAWSYAMQLKQDDQVEDNPRLRFHLMKRLRRATTWAAQLRDLCRECADECVATCGAVPCADALGSRSCMCLLPGARTWKRTHTWRGCRAHFPSRKKAGRRRTRPSSDLG